MFGRVRRKSSNVRAMQLFHELKQQFPTLPDHVVSACIANHAQKSNDNVLRETLEVAAAQQDPMGRTLSEVTETALPQPSEPDEKPLIIENGKEAVENKPVNQNKAVIGQVQASNSFEPISTDTSPLTERRRPDMNQSDSDDRNVISSSVRYDKDSESVNTSVPEINSFEQQVGNSSFFVKRPDTLDLPGCSGNVGINSDRNFNNIQPSGRCSDVHKLLNSNFLNNKPPRSPLSAKRFGNTKNSPTRSDYTIIRSPLASPENSRKFLQNSSEIESSKPTKETEPKRETVETPTQTTDTLLGGSSVNLSLNVNCSMDLVQSPTRPKCTTTLQLVPQPPWYQDIVSPRSYTSVNLTLRPPSSAPQPPIDITSQNSSLTYSTSSFDPQKGLQSRLQITVGPGSGGVASMRTRPRSSYHPDSDTQDNMVVRAGSLPDLAGNNNPVIEKQQARIERLKIELRTEKVKLVAMQGEVATLENSQNNAVTHKIDAELEKQLQKEIQHLRGQCEMLTLEVDRQCGSTVPLGETRTIFYDNIYTGQRGPITLGFPSERITSNHRNRPPHLTQPNSDFEGPKWNCHMCTFQNHPLLDKCEQCEMPRILHGKKKELPLRSRNSNYNPNLQYFEPNHMNARLGSQYSSPAGVPYQFERQNPLSSQFSSPAALGRSSTSPNFSPNGLDMLYGSSGEPNGNIYPCPNGRHNCPGSSQLHHSSSHLGIPGRIYNPFGSNENHNHNYRPHEAVNSATFNHNGH